MQHYTVFAKWHRVRSTGPADPAANYDANTNTCCDTGEPACCSANQQCKGTGWLPAPLHMHREVLVPCNANCPPATPVLPAALCTTAEGSVCCAQLDGAPPNSVCRPVGTPGGGDDLCCPLDFSELKESSI